MFQISPLPHVIELEKSFFLRMKCVLAKRNAGLTTNGFKVIVNSKPKRLLYFIDLDLNFGIKS